jgi:hypothetical protein
MNYKSPAFLLIAEGDETVIRKTNDHRIDGIVTGIIISCLVFPLLLLSIAVGMWMLTLALTEGTPWIIVIMGVIFSVGGGALLRFFSGTLMSFFPFTWKIRKQREGWELRKYVAGIRVFRRHGASWSLQCTPIRMAIGGTASPSALAGARSS